MAKKTRDKKAAFSAKFVDTDMSFYALTPKKGTARNVKRKPAKWKR